MTKKSTGQGPALLFTYHAALGLRVTMRSQRTVISALSINPLSRT
jgi:hypothetical protein